MRVEGGDADAHTEPELVTADAGPNPELADMSRRFWIGLVFAAPVLVLWLAAPFIAYLLSKPVPSLRPELR